MLLFVKLNASEAHSLWVTVKFVFIPPPHKKKKKKKKKLKQKKQEYSISGNNFKASIY